MHFFYRYSLLLMEDTRNDNSILDSDPFPLKKLHTKRLEIIHQTAEIRLWTSGRATLIIKGLIKAPRTHIKSPKAPRTQICSIPFLIKPTSDGTKCWFLISSPANYLHKILDKMIFLEEINIQMVKNKAHQKVILVLGM